MTFMDHASMIEYLKAELVFFRQAGYEPESRFKPASLRLRDSPSCLNFEPWPDLEARPCRDCKLYSLVPPEHRREFLPCHHIPLNDRGETIFQLQIVGSSARLNEEFEQWLVTTIHRLEQENTSAL